MEGSAGLLFTIIIVSKSLENATCAINSLKKINFDHSSYEVLLAIGNNPSEQRNTAVAQAKGKWILFLDNDSVVSSEILNCYLKIINSHEKVVAVGGPSILANSATIIEKSIDFVFSTFFGIGPMKARYHQTGAVRETNDKELILCNLVIHRESYIRLGGFNPILYPNEENFFLNHLKKSGGVFYGPSAYVERHHRQTLIEFARQIIRYGQGRTKQFRLKPKLIDFSFIIPFAVLPVMILLVFFPGLKISMLYMVLVVTHSALGQLKGANIFYLLVLYPLCHITYSFGLWSGLFVAVTNKVDSNVQVVKI